jgi:superfamily II DNA helicase RecQ
LLFNYADKWIPENFIESSHPSAEFLKETFARILHTAGAETLIAGDRWRRATGRPDPKFHSAVSLLDRAGFIARVNSAEGRGVRVLQPANRQLKGFNFEELERRREFEKKKFAVMLQYASRFRRHCFRSFVLRYFGEWSRVRDCGACSRCAPDRYPDKAVRAAVAAAPASAPRPDASAAADSGRSVVVALKILSCILRAQERLGRERVAKILAGSNDASVGPFRELTTYGILSDYSIPAIVGMIDHLILEGYVENGQGYRPAIGVTPKGRGFLKERPPISIPGV